jgi:uncharacterized membrane protein YcaP (DUF421 family)
MFDLQASWWELPARAAVIYVALLAMVRLSGRRTVGQFTPFDLLVVMLLSESVSTGLSGGEESVTGGLLAAGTLVVLNVAIAFATSRSARMQGLVEGRAVLVGRNGEIFRDILKQHRIPLCDVEQALREADCGQPDMKYAFLEADGKISILKETSSASSPLAASPRES